MLSGTKGVYPDKVGTDLFGGQKILMVLGMVVMLVVGSSLEVLAQKNITEEILFWEIPIMVASYQSELLSESPVPVTVITSKMIRRSGARTLKDLLIEFVPGYTHVIDQNEIIAANRGVYASSNQKVLILVDGHRLNSRVFQNANPDFGINISPDKVKQIEVMRGPGSVIYGNVALTGVINIVTKDADEIDGTVVDVGGGNFGQSTLRITHGKRFSPDTSLVFWSSYYRSNGEKIDISAAEDIASTTPQAGHAYLERYCEPVPYDLGVKYNYGRYELLAMRRQSSYKEPFCSNNEVGAVYDYEKYRTFSTFAPGQANIYNHIRLKYSGEKHKKYQFESALSYDTSIFQTTVIIGDGKHKFVRLNEETLGGIASLTRFYNADIGRGSVLFGLQAERMRLLDAITGTGTNYDWNTINDTADSPVVDLGKESIYSGFMQVKHYLPNEKFIFNTGLRFDYKDRTEGEDDSSELSSRLALIHKTSENLNLKLSYSESFVDSPYLYRHNQQPTYRNSDLKPEYLRSVQFTPLFKFPVENITVSLNSFYNYLYDVVYQDVTATTLNRYKNGGKLVTAGQEAEFAYLQKICDVRANATYQEVLSYSKFEQAGGHKVYSVPAFVGNMILDFHLNKKTNLNLTGRYIGKQLSPTRISPDYTVDDAVLVHCGIQVDDFIKDNIAFDVYVHNVFDRDYEQGGNPSRTYPEQGTSLLARLKYHFN